MQPSPSHLAARGAPGANDWRRALRSPETALRSPETAREALRNQPQGFSAPPELQVGHSGQDPDVLLRLVSADGRANSSLSSGKFLAQHIYLHDFRSFWCSLFPFVFLEPKPAYRHPRSPLSSLGPRRKEGRGRSVGKQGRSRGHSCTVAFQRQREKGVCCKLTTGCRLARTNRASVLTAFGGVLEKSPGICSGQRRDPLRRPVNLQWADLGPSHYGVAWMGCLAAPRFLNACPLPPPDAALLSSTNSTRKNAQVAAVPHAGTGPSPHPGWATFQFT